VPFETKARHTSQRPEARISRIFSSLAATEERIERLLHAPQRDLFGRTVSDARERVEAWGGRLVEVNGEPEHVHLLLTLPPKFALADFVNALKTGTSRRLRSEFAAEVNAVYRKPVLWSRSYCIISCGGAPLSVLKQYIENQERPE
jgi:putative transposase